MATQGKLLTGERRHRLLNGDPNCSKCDMVVETLMHVLRDCWVAKNLWQELHKGQIEREFIVLEGKDWFTWNLSKTDKDWSLVFGVACWMLWQWRNRWLFEDGFKLPISLGAAVYGYVREIHTARLDFGRSIGKSEEKYISWVPPRVGWVKLNVDGAAKGEGRKAGCGGLIRGSCGEWLGGFSRKIGRCSAIMSELWGVLTGLELAAHLNMQYVCVESDSTTVVVLLNRLQEEEVGSSSLLIDIAKRMGNFVALDIKHVYREANTCADAMANLSFVQEEVYTWFSAPPADIVSFLHRENMGVAYPRSVMLQ